MKDYKFVINASHGGDDSGVSGNGLVEKDFSLLISEYIYNRLNLLGYDVSMVRSTDETLSNEERIDRILNTYGGGNDVIIISNHLNDKGNDDVEIVYALRNSNILPNNIATNLEKNNIDISKVYQRRLPSDTSKDYYFIHRDTKNTIPVAIYYGSVDNANNANNLKNNYKQYGDAVVDGILSFIGVSTNTGSGTNNNKTYTVKSGDSLWSIAKKFETGVDEIKTINNLSSNLLNIGQVLTIPSKNIPSQTGDYIVYTVSSGDTLYNIAKKYNLSVSDIVNYNDLASTSLKIGQQLLIPVTKEENVYIVKQGDNLYSIASRYNITVDELKKYNNLTSNILNIGQRLNIPPSETNNYLSYVVKQGDSLYSIANKYNTTVSEIMKLNNLKTNLVNIGQVLKIPTLIEEITYIVKSGDNLYSIANRYNVTVDEIKRKNNLTSNNLRIGQKLII